jgi:hypothetical protein
MYQSRGIERRDALECSGTIARAACIMSIDAAGSQVTIGAGSLFPPACSLPEVGKSSCAVTTNPYSSS